nr:PREDICTED: uncharacterized protein LOC109035104 isoform X2 [Bemisia tabaci]
MSSVNILILAGLFIIVGPDLCPMLTPIEGPYQNRIWKIGFNTGDLVVVPSVGNFDASPYHWMFAVSNTELAGISVTKRSFFNRRAHIVIFNQDLRDQIWRTKASRVPHILGRPDMSRKGAIIAKRLSDKKVYFNILRCNCGHYTDYFAYGRVYGIKGKITHLPINKSCPLYNVITEDTDVTSENFKLVDGYGRKFDLLPYKEEMAP